MTRAGITIAALVVGVVALAFAWDEPCDGSDQGLFIGSAVVGLCAGAITWAALRGRLRDRPATLWNITAGAAGTAFLVLVVLGILVWVGECSA